AYVAQMAVYAAVLAELYPDRPVEAALVWTDGPKLTPVPPALMAEALARLTLVARDNCAAPAGPLHPRFGNRATVRAQPRRLTWPRSRSPTTASTPTF